MRPVDIDSPARSGGGISHEITAFEGDRSRTDIAGAAHKRLVFGESAGEKVGAARRIDGSAAPAVGAREYAVFRKSAVFGRAARLDKERSAPFVVLGVGVVSAKNAILEAGVRAPDEESSAAVFFRPVIQKFRLRDRALRAEVHGAPVSSTAHIAKDTVPNIDKARRSRFRADGCARARRGNIRKRTVGKGECLSRFAEQDSRSVAGRAVQIFELHKFEAEIARGVKDAAPVRDAASVRDDGGILAASNGKRRAFRDPEDALISRFEQHDCFSAVCQRDVSGYLQPFLRNVPQQQDGVVIGGGRKRVMQREKGSVPDAGRRRFRAEIPYFASGGMVEFLVICADAVAGHISLVVDRAVEKGRGRGEADHAIALDDLIAEVARRVGTVGQAEAVSVSFFLDIKRAHGHALVVDREIVAEIVERRGFRPDIPEFQLFVGEFSLGFQL